MTAEGERPYWFYVVACRDGSLYAGYTTDLDARIEAHNAGAGAKYTRSRRPVRLVASAAFATQHEALSAEFHFKRLTRARKLAFVALPADAFREKVLAELVTGGDGDAGRGMMQLAETDARAE